MASLIAAAILVAVAIVLFGAALYLALRDY